MQQNQKATEMSICRMAWKTRKKVNKSVSVEDCCQKIIHREKRIPWTCYEVTGEAKGKNAPKLCHGGT